MIPKPPTDSVSTARFDTSPIGSLRHWMVSGPLLKPHTGPAASERDMRRNSLDYSTITPPETAELGAIGPSGLPWKFHDPNRNEYVEFSTFNTEPTVVEYLAFTEVSVAESGTWMAQFWAAGAADLWVNGGHIDRLNVTRYRNPDFHRVALPFKQGLNRLCVRLQCLGLRDTRILFALFLEQPHGVVIEMRKAARIAEASRWIDSVRAFEPHTLRSASPAPFDAEVLPRGGDRIPWPKGAETLPLPEPRADTLSINVTIDGVTLHRKLEIPANRPIVEACDGDRHLAHLNFVAKAGVGGEAAPGWNAIALPLLARRLLGRTAAEDAAVFAACLSMVDKRYDCSDFILAALLRMEKLGLLTPAESAALRDSALGYRYWPDEPGNDAMCFHSENHSLLFHGCQLLAGLLYGQDRFVNSGRSGPEQVVIALERIRKWLEHVEARGFEEFNSSTYIPITIGAMLNVVDFSPDAELSRRMSLLVDRIFRDLAKHVFDGVVISPQGRVYRDVLYPEAGGTLVLLAYATCGVHVELQRPYETRMGTGVWVPFLASTSYRVPPELPALLHEAVSTVYRQADMQIVLEKTPAYLLTSLAVPAVPREGEHPKNDLRPGGAGYQQHLWQATLGKGCHIFVNHPGGFFDETSSRPGYWHGNGLIPRLRQQGNWLQAIYVISDGGKTQPEITPETWEWGTPASVRPYDLHPVAFTHAHWPSDAFDAEEIRPGWRFGQRGRGMIGLWCSETLVPHDDILTGRELRANGYASAWLVVCGDTKQDGSLADFAETCQAREPRFDRDTFTLHMRGEEPTRWWERSEPMPG